MFNPHSKPRIFYRINYEKLQKYRHRKSISTQTTFNNDLNSSIHSSTNTLSTISNDDEHTTSASTDFGTSESLSEIQPGNFNSSKSFYIRSIVRHMFGDYSYDTEQD